MRGLLRLSRTSLRPSAPGPWTLCHGLATLVFACTDDPSMPTGGTTAVPAPPSGTADPTGSPPGQVTQTNGTASGSSGTEETQTGAAPVPPGSSETGGVASTEDGSTSGTSTGEAATGASSTNGASTPSGASESGSTSGGSTGGSCQGPDCDLAPPFSHGPLEISDDGHFLAHEDGTPFFFLGDTAWLLVWRLDRTEMMAYLDDRQQNDYTVVLAPLAISFGGQNPYGETVFEGGDKSRPNEAFFEHVDALIEGAKARGLYVGLVPAWGNESLGGDNDLGAHAEPYGHFLATRYLSKPNVFWVLGGDTTSGQAVYEDILAGIRGAGDSRLVTWHPNDCCSSSSVYPNASAVLDFNMLQTGHSAQNLSPQRIWDDYDLTPAKPTLNAEPNYEHHPIAWNAGNGYFTPLDVRKQAYWGVFAGAAGHVYGSHSVWQFWKPGSQPVASFLGGPENGIAWYDAVKSDGSVDVGYLPSLMLSRPYFDRMPDQGFLASAPGTGGNLVVATRDRNGRFAMVYTPTGQPFDVHLDRLSGQDAKAWWWNPRTGQATDAGTTASTGTKRYTPPSREDWVLVVDDAALDFGAPGR